MKIRAAVLGAPIAHSKSPLLHRAAFAALGLDSSEYSRHELFADELEAFLDAHPEHTGFSLTMPLKHRLVALADERGWLIDDTAALTGAGNTLVRTGEARLVANTDVRGIVAAIEAQRAADLGHGAQTSQTDSAGIGGSAGATRGAGVGRSAGAGRATILGAGATAASALVACRDLGITHVDIRVRNPDRARSVLDLAARMGLATSLGDLDRIELSEIVISTLPAEAAPQPVWDGFPATGGGVALDVAYAAESKFLTSAAAHGLQPVIGTAMLVEQAVAQFEMFLTASPTTADEPGPQLPAGPELRERIADAMYAALADPGARSRD